MSAQLSQPVVAPMFSGNGPAQVTQAVRLVDTQTGEVIERIPTIAREIIACNNGRFVYEGDYVASTPSAVSTGEGAGDDGNDELPSTRALPEALAAMTDVEAITAMAARDTRKSAAPLYAARLAALSAT